jgi:hypothetical protein
MTAIHLRAPHGDWPRFSHRPRRAGRLLEKVLSAVRDWRRHRRNRHQIAALKARISRDIEICCSDPLDLEREQKERDAWLDTLRFPPF